MNGEKRYIPRTNPEWDLELPEDCSNSLVARSGKNHDDGYNFDERDDLDEEVESVNKAEKTENVPEFDPEAAKRRYEEVKKMENSRQRTEQIQCSVGLFKGANIRIIINGVKNPAVNYRIYEIY